MSLPTWALDPKAERITVYYEGTSTIREGMPLCYNYDTTDNWTGAGAITATTTATNLTETGTTAEGSQNEGKFIRVEDPTTANLQWFAGVVAGSDHAGQAGPRALDIYIPNGAIVPVRSYVSSTVGVNALAIMNGQIYLGNPNASTTNGAARYVAIAEETVDRSSTAGLCLARLCPDEFLYQSQGTTKLMFATAGTVDVAANFINADSNQTSGGFTALWVRSNTDAAGNSDTALGIYGEANVNAVFGASSLMAHRFSLNLWGGTQTAGEIAAVQAEIYEEGANLTGSTLICPLFLRTQIDSTNPPAANSHYMIACRVDGADKPDGLLFANSADAVGFIAKTSAAVTHVIPIRVAGTTYWLMVSNAA